MIEKNDDTRHGIFFACLSVDSNQKVVLQLATIQSTPCKSEKWNLKNPPICHLNIIEVPKPPWVPLASIRKTSTNFKINKVSFLHTKPGLKAPNSGEVGLFELQLDTVMILSCLPTCIHQIWYFFTGHGWLIFVHGVGGGLTKTPPKGLTTSNLKSSCFGVDDFPDPFGGVPAVKSSGGGFHQSHGIVWGRKNPGVA